VTPSESQIYRDLMRFKPEGLSPNAWAVKAGVSRTVWTDMRRHGNPSRRTLEKLLTAAGSSLLEFEALRLGPEPAHFSSSRGAHLSDLVRDWNAAPLSPLPLVRSSLAGQWGELGSEVEVTEVCPGERIESLPRPVALANDPNAYAFTIVGTAMWPRFRTGSRVAVSPRSPVAIGDDVIVRLRREDQNEGVDRVLVVQLVKRTATGFELRQFNPDRIIQIDAGDSETILKIVGELI
jgi:phage repressor protein C with HTH and peptisase S24 domain